MIPGILIAEDGMGVSQGEYKFDSRARHLPIDLEASPRHYDIVEMAGGTALGIAANSTETKQETLLEIPHKLGYTPFCIAYFYIISKNGNAVSAPAGNYSGDFYPYSGSLGTLSDFITYKVNRESFRIIHYLNGSGLGPAYTSDANTYQLRIKYYIASIDTGVDSYSGSRLTII